MSQLMNSEENRLQTFRDWPTSSPISKLTLARCGFFATGRNLQAECNWCHYTVNVLDCRIPLDVLHSIAESQCPFIINRDGCGNIPLCDIAPEQPTQPTNIPTQSEPDLYVESNRLATFKNWPNPNISPQSLAKAGFFYLNRSDEVKCAWCQGVIAKWEKEDNAFEEHQRFFPECPRVQLGPLIEITSGDIRSLGIQQITPPKRPKFSSLDARLRTYTNWPIRIIQQPDALAEAGLYYQDIDDQVRCFHCNIGLRSWQPEDDPWFEHAKWYPQCQFVRLAKGPGFIKEVHEAMRQTSQLNQPTPAVTTRMTIEEAMSTQPVRQALEIGIDGGSIRNATQRHLLANGRPYDTVEDLVKAVFGDNDDDDVGRTDYAGPSSVRKITRGIDSMCSLGGQLLTRNAPSTSIISESNTNNIAAATAPLLAPTAPISTNETDVSVANSAPHSQAPIVEGKTDGEVVPSVSAKHAEPSVRSLSLEEENRKLKDARLCKVCLDEDVCVVFLPCGHFVTCMQCAPSVTQCPMCRTPIKGIVRTFLS